MLRSVLCCLLIAGVLHSPAFSRAETPPVFEAIGEIQELQRVLEQSDRVLVSFSVPWCMGCLRMDRIVWSDPGFAQRLDSLDACVRPREEFLDAYRETYGVHGFPELILFENAQEIGRLRGFWDTERVIAWLNEPTLKTEPGDPQLLPIGEVHDRAIDLLLEQRWDEAAEFMSVFWVRSAHDRAMTDTLRWLRSARYPSMLRRVAQSDAGRLVLERLHGTLPRGGPSAESDARLIHDWLVLSLALDRTEQVDVWTDRMLGHAHGREMLSGHEEVFDRLRARGMEREAGAVLGSSVWSRWVARARGEPTGDPIHDAAPGRVVQNEQARAPERLRVFHDALREAGRDQEADKIGSVLADD